jgi:hypothetical protein
MLPPPTCHLAFLFTAFRGPSFLFPTIVRSTFTLFRDPTLSGLLILADVKAFSKQGVWNSTLARVSQNLSVNQGV